jgi:hypothetical protein
MKNTTETMACLLAVAAILAIAAGAERSKPKHLMPAVALTAPQTPGAGSSAQVRGRKVG